MVRKGAGGRHVLRSLSGIKSKFMAWVGDQIHGLGAQSCPGPWSRVGHSEVLVHGPRGIKAKVNNPPPS